MVRWIAGIASFFVVGLGQAINGEFLKGLKFFLTFVALGILRIVVPFTLGNPDQPFAPMPVFAGLIGLVMAGIYFIQLADAFGVIDADDYIPYL